MMNKNKNTGHSVYEGVHFTGNSRGSEWIAAVSRWFTVHLTLADTSFVIEQQSKRTRVLSGRQIVFLSFSRLCPPLLGRPGRRLLHNFVIVIIVILSAAQYNHIGTKLLITVWCMLVCEWNYPNESRPSANHVVGIVSEHTSNNRIATSKRCGLHTTALEDTCIGKDVATEKWEAFGA